MAKDINLLHDVTLSEEKSFKTQKLLTISSMAILSIGIVALVAVITMSLVLSNNITSIKDTNASLKNDVTRYADTELLQRNIKAKLTSVKTILSNSHNYSEILGQVQELVPGGVTIGNITLGDKGAVTLAGKANDSTAFDTFVNNIIKKSDGANPTFNSVNLGSLSTDKEGNIQFNITMNLGSAGPAKTPAIQRGDEQ